MGFLRVPSIEIYNCRPLFINSIIPFRRKQSCPNSLFSTTQVSRSFGEKITRLAMHLLIEITLPHPMQYCPNFVCGKQILWYHSANKLKVYSIYFSRAAAWPHDLSCKGPRYLATSVRPSRSSWATTNTNMKSEILIYGTCRLPLLITP